MSLFNGLKSEKDDEIAGQMACESGRVVRTSDMVRYRQKVVDEMRRKLADEGSPTSLSDDELYEAILKVLSMNSNSTGEEES